MSNTTVSNALALKNLLSHEKGKTTGKDAYKRLNEKKRSERHKHCACAGCSKVWTPPAHSPARCKHQSHRQDRLQYTAPQRASTQYKNDLLGGFVLCTNDYMKQQLRHI